MVPVKREEERYCEMCGQRIVGPYYSVKIEGSHMVLCRSCYERVKRYAESAPSTAPVRRSSVAKPQQTKSIRTSEEWEIDENYALKVREARERLKMSTRELANKMRTQENVIKRIEQGKLKPTLDQARDLEKILGIKLLVKVEADKVESFKPEDFTLTLGDIINIREGRK
ncbi:MAG: multiprotein bridging factor aMBF1 [Metallosphaera yellowstonensis]|jgi:Predicted transcription factor, homolog of eukaryotic MBF1